VELLQEVLKPRNAFIRVIGFRDIYFFSHEMSHLFAKPFDQFVFFPKDTPDELAFLLYDRQ